ncbi:MAG: SDR family oxidoreductase [Pseudomonadota bacterium]
MDLGLRGKSALVTGATRGIGRCCAEIFAAEGANIAICARHPGEVHETVAALEGENVKVHGRVLDVSEKAPLEEFVASSAEAFGGLDIIVANASALAMADDEEAWRASYEIDLMHTVRLVNAAMPWLERSNAASITAISSVSGREIDPGGAAYGAFKATLVHYMHGLAVKLADKNIRANSVSPGTTYFEGGIWHRIESETPDVFAGALLRNPTGRMARPEEIARGVVFLASPASSFTTGTNLVIDGALTRGVQL